MQVKGIEVTGANAPISALDLYPPNLTLAVGNESGLVRKLCCQKLHKSGDITLINFDFSVQIFLYQLQGDSYQATVTIVTETKHQGIIYNMT